MGKKNKHTGPRDFCTSHWTAFIKSHLSLWFMTIVWLAVKVFENASHCCLLFNSQQTLTHPLPLLTPPPAYPLLSSQNPFPSPFPLSSTKIPVCCSHCYHSYYHIHDCLVFIIIIIINNGCCCYKEIEGQAILVRQKRKEKKSNASLQACQITITSNLQQKLKPFIFSKLRKFKNDRQLVVKSFRYLFDMKPIISQD